MRLLFNKTFFLFLLVLYCNICRSTDSRVIYEGTGCCPYLNTIELLPNDTITTKFSIIVFASTGGEGKLLNKTFKTNGATIDISICYMETAATRPEFYLDTFVIENVLQQTYTMNISLYLTYSENECIKIDSTMASFQFRFDSLSALKTLNYKKNVYPNPCDQYVILEGYNLPINIKIFNLNGQLRAEKQMNERFLDVVNLDRGVYILRVEDNFYKISKR